MLGFSPLAAAPIAAQAEAIAPSAAAIGTIDATIDITADIAGGVGVVGTISATVDIAADTEGAHGVAGTIAGTLDITAAIAGAHGVAGAMAASVDITAAVVAIHERYEVRGEVRVDGILVNRQVRAHLRSTGAVIGDVATVAGKFHIHTGFAPAEHYIVPIHLDSAATDWSPPTANRVLSVLAEDV